MAINYYISNYDENRILSLKLKKPYSFDINLFKNMMENVFVTFSMYQESTNSLVIANKEGYVSQDIYGIFYINYKFDNINLKKDKYIGQFNLKFNNNYCGDLIVPIEEPLQIFVEENITKTTLVNVYDIPQSICDYIIDNILFVIQDISLIDIKDCNLDNGISFSTAITDSTFEPVVFSRFQDATAINNNLTSSASISTWSAQAWIRKKLAANQNSSVDLYVTNTTNELGIFIDGIYAFQSFENFSHKLWVSSSGFYAYTVNGGATTVSAFSVAINDLLRIRIENMGTTISYYYVRNGVENLIVSATITSIDLYVTYTLNIANTTLNEARIENGEIIPLG